MTLSLVSCGGEKKADTVPETDAATSSTETEVTDTTAEESVSAPTDVDFSTVSITNYAVISVGEKIEVAEGTAAEKTDIVKIDGASLVALTVGQTLISSDGANATVVCVLPENQAMDPSAGDPTLVYSGDVLDLQTDIPNPTFTSSNTEVIEVDGNVGYCKAGGYTVITAANASVPRFYSYIVIERN